MKKREINGGNEIQNPCHKYVRNECKEEQHAKYAVVNKSSQHTFISLYG